MPQLSKLQLTGLFEALREQLPPKLKSLVATAQDLTEPVDSGEYYALEAKDKKLEVTDGEVEIFKQPFGVSGKLAADLLVHKPEAEVPILTFLDPKDKKPVFDEAEILTAPGQVLSELRFEAGADIKGDFKAPQGALSANAAAGGGLVYRHLRPSPIAGTNRLEALTKLLETSRPPALVDLELDAIEPSEIHVLEARFNFDLGLDLKFGGNVKLQEDLNDLKPLFEVFDAGMPEELKVDVEYSLQASFGYSLYQDMQLAVGRFNLLDDTWLRMRIQRLRRSELTLGAQLDLQVEYDLAKDSLVGLFDRILALDPTKSFMKSLQEVQELRADGGWDAVRDKLVATVGEDVDEFLDSVDWREWISDSDAAKIDGLLDELQGIVKAYDELPDKIRSLWDTLLSKANLGPDSKVLAALRQIEAIDLDDPAALLGDVLSDEWKSALSLLETLTGLSLNELVLSQADSLRAALKQAQELATKALAFLAEVPEKAIGMIQSFAERTGIESAVAWLRDNATTSVDDLLAALKTKANEQIQQLVTRLVGKAWAAIDADDLAKLGEWLDRIEAILKKKKMWEEKISGYLDRLEGELGFSFSLELNRLSERSALVDLEFDPKGKVREAVSDALLLGQVRKLLAELPEEDSIEEAGYRLREAVVSSRRVRTSTMSVLFSLFDLQRSRDTMRVDEETIRVTQESGNLIRTGSYEGGAVRTLSDDSTKAAVRTLELEAWLSMQATGSGGDLKTSYDGGMQEQGLRLTFSRKDDDTHPDEITGLGILLSDLGFPVGPTQLDALSGMPITDLALSLALGKDAVGALLSAVDETAWNVDFLNAGHRWFDEELIKAKKIKEIRAGRVLAGVVETQDFQGDWLRTSDFLNKFGTAQGNVRSVKVSLPGQTVNVPAIRRSNLRDVIIMLPGVFELVESRERALKGLQGAQAIHAELDMSSPDPKAMRKLAARFSTAMARTAFLGKGLPNIFPEQWSNALFNLWYVFARVGRIAPAALADTKGLAELRFKAKAEDDWQEPLRWLLPIGKGLPAAKLPDLFPIQLTAAPVVAAAAGLGMPGDQAVASKNSKFFHASADCASARRIKKENRLFGAEARRNREAHQACNDTR